MFGPDVSVIVEQLQKALNYTGCFGQIILHVADSKVGSIELVTTMKCPKGVDKK